MIARSFCSINLEDWFSRIRGAGDAELCACGTVNDVIELVVDRTDKYKEEDVVFDAAGKAFLFDGILLNREDLSSTYLPENLAASPQFGRDLGAVLSRYRGNFRGLVFDGHAGRISLFTDHLGNRPLYYYVDGQCLLCGSSVFDIARALKRDGKLKADMFGAYAMLTYGYMVGDTTPFQGVKRLDPGSILTVDMAQAEAGKDFLSEDGGRYSVESFKYYVFDNEPIPVGEDTAISKIDELFTQAVRRQLMFNERYDLANYCALSAGLDSRMTAFALQREGASDIRYFTYSQSFHDDCLVPMKITSDNLWSWIYKNLDGGSDLLGIAPSIEAANAVIYYPWMSQLMLFLNSVETRDMGLIHTGVIGDVVVGSFMHGSLVGRKTYTLGDGAWSTRLIDRLEAVCTLRLPADVEEGMMANRAINGAALGYSLGFSKVSEAASPFMDIDLFSYCMHIPSEMRQHHNLYYAWVEKCYPEAARYPHNGVRITNKGPRLKHHGTDLPAMRVPSLMMNKIKALSPKNSMNPFEHWYAQNPRIEEGFKEYYSAHREILDFDLDLQKDADLLFEVGTVREKTLAISLVGLYSQAEL